MLENFIPLASPDIQEQDIERVVKVLRSGMLVQGENVALLEKSFTDFHNCSQAIALSNGTATMHLALVAMGIGAGDEVIVPAFSYVATANVVELVGATCVFVDIDLATFNIDVTKVEAAISAKTKAIIPVHEFGLAADIEALMATANKYNIPVLEDAACALGAMQNNKYVGTFGQLGSFSLHPRKSITSGEGGVLTSNDATISKKIRQLRNHGIEMQDGQMDFVCAGFNYRMTDFQAALVHSQMQRLQEIIIKKQSLADVYFQEIKNQNIQLPFVPSDRNHTWQTFHVVAHTQKTQKDIIAYLKSNNIGANYGAQCIPAMTYYQKKYSHDSKQQFNNAYIAFTKGIALPLYDKLNSSTIQQIAKIINTI